MGREDALLAEDVNADDDIVLWERNSVDPPTFNESLSPHQTKELQALLRQFPGILGPEPGRTHIIEHFIDTNNASPIKLPPYRLPHAHRDAVNQELEEMEKARTIEPSSSPWDAPPRPVRKKDGSMRLCVDYLRLNSVSRQDAYPMPRIDDLIDDLGGAKFITTLDLAKGYWCPSRRKTGQRPHSSHLEASFSFV